MKSLQKLFCELSGKRKRKEHSTLRTLDENPLSVGNNSDGTESKNYEKQILRERRHRLMYTDLQNVRSKRSFKRRSSLLCLTSLTFIERLLKLSYYDNFYVFLVYHAIISVYAYRAVQLSCQKTVFDNV